MTRLPAKNDLLTLDYAWRGTPLVHVEAKPLNTLTLDYPWHGTPFVAPLQVRHRRIFLVE